MGKSCSMVIAQLEDSAIIIVVTNQARQVYLDSWPLCQKYRWNRGPSV